MSKDSDDSVVSSSGLMADDISGLKAVTVAKDFKLEFIENRSATGAIIYANNENKVGIKVSVKLMRDGNPVVISSADFLKNLFLYDLSTHTSLSWNGEEPLKQLFYADVAGDYAGAVGYSPSQMFNETTSYADQDDYTHSFIFYVYASKNAGQNYDVYARLEGLNTNEPLFSKGYIDTSGQFTPIPQSIKHIQALPAIDYSQSQHWTLQYSDWITKGTLEKSLEAPSVSGLPVDVRRDVESRYRTLRLINKNYDASHPLKFKKREFSGEVITEYVGKSVLRGQPSAFFGWGFYDPHYDVIAWWIEPGLEGRHTPGYKAIGYVNPCACELHTPSGYRVTIKIKENGQQEIYVDVDDVRDDAITLYQWDLRTEFGDLTTDGWSDISHDTTITVWDMYGNNGKLKIKFPTDKWDASIVFGS